MDVAWEPTRFPPCSVRAQRAAGGRAGGGSTRPPRSPRRFSARSSRSSGVFPRRSPTPTWRSCDASALTVRLTAAGVVGNNGTGDDGRRLGRTIAASSRRFPAQEGQRNWVGRQRGCIKRSGRDPSLPGLHRGRAPSCSRMGPRRDPGTPRRRPRRGRPSERAARGARSPGRTQRPGVRRDAGFACRVRV